MEPKFLKCAHCGNIVEMLHDSGVQVVCCGEPMKEITANTQEAATEKHLPDVKVENGVIHVQVGSVIHPMVEEHYIMWVWLATKKGGQRAAFRPGEEPKAAFVLAPGDEAVAVYEYCNIHGLWKTSL